MIKSQTFTNEGCFHLCTDCLDIISEFHHQSKKLETDSDKVEQMYRELWTVFLEIQI